MVISVNTKSLEKIINQFLTYKESFKNILVWLINFRK